jgi:hypothetical protein
LWFLTAVCKWFRSKYPFDQLSTLVEAQPPAVSIHWNRHRIILVCVFHPLGFSTFAVFAGHHHVILVYFPSVVFSFRCVYSLWSLFRYIVFYFPVSLEFVVFVHCGLNRIILVYFPFIVFSLCRVCLSWSYHPYMFSIICVFLSLCLFIVVIILI